MDYWIIASRFIIILRIGACNLGGGGIAHALRYLNESKIRKECCAMGNRIRCEHNLDGVAGECNPIPGYAGYQISLDAPVARDTRLFTTAIMTLVSD